MGKKTEEQVEKTTKKTEDKENRELEKLKEEKRQKRRTTRRIINAILTILLLFAIIDAIIGVISLQKVNNGEKPIWYLSSKTEEHNKKTVTRYNIVLYDIVITDTNKETKITLKPFFLRD